MTIQHYVSDKGFDVSTKRDEVMSHPKIECTYCMHNVTASSEDEQPPELNDDAAWAKIAKGHAATCEWVQTRAHRKPAAQVGA